MSADRASRHGGAKRSGGSFAFVPPEAEEPELSIVIPCLDEEATLGTCIRKAQHALVELAVEATKVLGVEPRLDQSSTDSNLPISLGIPAITLGAGGTSGSSHTLAEWYDPTDRDLGLKRALLVMLGLVGLAAT